LDVEAEVVEEWHRGVQQLRGAGAESGDAEIEDAQALDGARQLAQFLNGAFAGGVGEVVERSLGQRQCAVHADAPPLVDGARGRQMRRRA
jgi:hypothetical protein